MGSLRRPPPRSRCPPSLSRTFGPVRELICINSRARLTLRNCASAQIVSIYPWHDDTVRRIGMNRPTIADLAKAANVSVSTVNRILAGSTSVRTATIQRVQDAADEIGYYGLGVIAARKQDSLPHYRLGFLLQQSS